MIRSAASKVMWVGRATVFMVGLAVILALVFGVATSAMGANGKPFLLGKRNVASAVSTLIKQGPGPALNLVVGAGQPPLSVNATAGKATNLDADRVDGRSFGCPGGTLFHEGVCIEVAKRPVDLHAGAHQDCIDEGRRLPSVEELLTFRNRSGHDFAGNTAEFTSQVEYNGTNVGVNLVAPDGSVRWAGAGGSSLTNYRCVSPPV